MSKERLGRGNDLVESVCNTWKGRALAAKERGIVKKKI